MTCIPYHTDLATSVRPYPFGQLVHTTEITTDMTYDDARPPPPADLNDLFSVPTDQVPRSDPGLSALAARAMARIWEETSAGTVSSEAKMCMQSPVATALARALCDDASDTADLMVADLMEAGLTVEDICLDHLAPAARCLGEWWEVDRLPFTEVTLATSRIQAMLCRMPASRAMPLTISDKGAVFCAVPGEQHTLGVMMAADLFRRNGWDVTLLVGLAHDEMLSRLARDDRRVIGLSCSGDHSRDALGALMHGIRKVRPDAHILLSGGITGDAEAMSCLPRADAIVSSVEEAEAWIEDLAGRISAEA